MQTFFSKQKPKLINKYTKIKACQKLNCMLWISNKSVKLLERYSVRNYAYENSYTSDSDLIVIDMYNSNKNVIILFHVKIKILLSNVAIFNNMFQNHA